MAVRLPALRTGRPLPPRFLVSFLLVAESTPGPSAAGRFRSIEKNPTTSSGLEPAIFRLIVPYLNELRYRVPPSSRYLQGSNVTRTRSTKAYAMPTRPSLFHYLPTMLSLSIYMILQSVCWTLAATYTQNNTNTE
jgi:hypothetical protein